MDKIETKITWVRRLSDEGLTTLDAYSAVARLEMLLSDIKRLKSSFSVTLPENPYSSWRSFPVDIVSYYPVAFVTCLEWHARARLADLLTFIPTAIEESDLNREFGARNLSRLIAARVSIPYFVAATKNFSTSESYVRNFARIFRALGLSADASTLIHAVGPTVRSGSQSGYECLTWMYDYRNSLVHEINQTHVGHPFFHDQLDCDEALEIGEFTLKVIKAMELEITIGAPKGFPQKLTAHGGPTDQEKELEEEILDLEERVVVKLGESAKAALLLSRQAKAAEEEMILLAPELHNRWLDLKTPVRLALQKARLSYLHTLLATLN